MKRFFTILLSLALSLTMLAGCKDTQDPKVTENSFTPASDITLGGEFYAADDLTQLRNKLFALKDGAIYCADLITGESSKISDGSYKYCSVNGELAYFYDPAAGDVAAYDVSGALVSTVNCPSLVCEAKGFAATDNYFAVHISNQIIICDKQGAEYKKNDISNFAVEIHEFKSDDILMTLCDSVGSRMRICVHYLEKGGTKDIYRLDYLADINDVCYSEYEDTVIAVLNDYYDNSIVTVSPTGDKELPTTRISRCPVGGKLTVSGNVMCAVGDDEILIRDFDNSPESLTVLQFGSESELRTVFRQFEKETGTVINIVSYGGDDAAVVYMKMMAGDKDVDLYAVMPLSIPHVYRQDAYVELYDYPQLKERFESNAFAKHLATYDGKCFGVPYNARYEDKDTFSVKGMEEDMITSGWLSSYSENGRLTTKYIHEEINIMTGEYSDPDGEKLYEIMRWLYDHPDDPFENPIYPHEISLVYGDFLVLNRRSEKKDEAVKLLAHVFDMYSEAKMAEDVDVKHIYPEVENVENAYNGAHRTRELINVLSIDKILATDGSDEALRKLAKDTAAKFNMVING